MRHSKYYDNDTTTTTNDNNTTNTNDNDNNYNKQIQQTTRTHKTRWAPVEEEHRVEPAVSIQDDSIQSSTIQENTKHIIQHVSSSSHRLLSPNPTLRRGCKGYAIH